MKYVIITPAKNEEKYIEFTIESIINQTIKPQEWIIVDDGSIDNTKSIIKKYENEYSWIKLISNNVLKKRESGAKVVQAFNFGFKFISKEYDYIVKLDADLSLPEKYFESIIQEFSNDPKLGLCGGYILNKYDNKLIREKTADYHVRGAFKSFRKLCFNEIGGFIPVLGWDGLDEMSAMYHGWKTKTIEVPVIHHRPTQSSYSVFDIQFKIGHSAYQRRNNFLLTIFRTIYKMAKPPYFIGGIAFLFGYIKGFLKNEKAVIDKDFIRYINKYHYKRILQFKIL